MPPERQPLAKLDPGFSPLGLFHRTQVAAAKAAGSKHVLQVALERENGNVSRFETPIGDPADAVTLTHAERLVKFFLWSVGGWRLFINAPAPVSRHLASCYSARGERAFDVDMMQRIYEKSFEVAPTSVADMPAARELTASLGGHLDGCRIGFDLGASDYKVAAVRDGEVVYTDEFPWTPSTEPDPEYHYRHLRSGIARAAEHLPQVDAIGGSSAGAIVSNRFMAASLIRSITPEKMQDARNMFLRLRGEFQVPIEVANDGDVTALAGAMSLGVSGVLGVAMGSSQAAGYIDPRGKITGWLNELAFVPVDINPDAAVDEWSGDGGVGALYFSQQAVNKLMPAAGIEPPANSALPERLKYVQALMASGDTRARGIYETIGAYLGHAIPIYAAFYKFEHMLLLGRVTTGDGGNIILDHAREVLMRDYADLAESVQIHLPDEKSRRHGQAVVAASLPKIHD